MINLNEVIKETSSSLSKTYWLELFLPNIYLATSVKDFLEDKKNVKPKKTILPVGIFFQNYVGVGFENPLIFNKKDSLKGEFSDISHSFEFNLNDLPKDKDAMSTGEKIYDLKVLYHPKKEYILIVDYDLFGPSSSEKDIKEELEEKINLVFGFS